MRLLFKAMLTVKDFFQKIYHAELDSIDSFYKQQQ
jgi:hypothetical protein